jgi:hypothetical protein
MSVIGRFPGQTGHQPASGAVVVGRVTSLLVIDGQRAFSGAQRAELMWRT